MDSEGRIGWGVLGAAGVARRRFLPALRAATNAQLVILGSRSLEHAAAAVEAVGQGRPVSSYEAVLEDPEVEAVYLPLPNALHREWALKALDAGKHVLCEKPLVLSSSAVDELAQAAVSADRVVMEAFMYRLHPQYERSTWEPLLRDIGAIRLAQARFSFPFDRPGDIRENAELGGGALWDIGSYCLDVLTWQLGDVVEVQALGDLRGGTIWTAAIELRSPQDRLGRRGAALQVHSRSDSRLWVSTALSTSTVRSVPPAQRLLELRLTVRSGLELTRLGGHPR